MQLTHLQISNFRNLDQVSLELSPMLNVICGANGQGKTNLLESIFYLVTGRSFRTHLDSAVLPKAINAADDLRIEGTVTRAGGGRNRLTVTISQGIKRISIDDKPVGQLASLWGRLRAVLFTPDDIGILKGGPSLRRRMIDISLSQMDCGYLSALQKYMQALRQRNALLREALPGREPRDQIMAFNHPLAEWGAIVHQLRSRYISQLSPIAAGIYRAIAPAAEQLALEYQDTLKSGAAENPQLQLEQLLECFNAGIDDDIRRRQTLHGIHREDIRFLLNGHDLRHYGSQGQFRTAMLCVRLAEIEMMEQWCAEAPILLLDDLASELDAQRRERLFERIHGRLQTLLTATDPAVVGRPLGNCLHFHVQNGTIQPAENKR